MKIGKNEGKNQSSSRGGDADVSESFLEKERSRISNLELSDSASISNLEISASLLNYLNNSASLSRNLAFKWLGIDSGENRNQLGQGICFLNVSLNGLIENEKGFKDGKFSGMVGKFQKGRIGKEVREEMRKQKEMEIQDVEHWKKSYMKLNDTVSERMSGIISGFFSF